MKKSKTETTESTGNNLKRYCKEVAGECADCGVEVHAEVPVMLLREISQEPMLCPSCGGKRAKEREDREFEESVQKIESISTMWLQRIPKRYREKSFDTFDPGTLFIKALDMAKRYASMVVEKGFVSCPSLMMASEGKGTGKTHLAAAIGKYVINEIISLYPDISLACPILFTTATELFLRIRATYRNDADETEADIIRQIERIPLLILDDVGKEKPSEHTRATYYTIFNCRYNADKPIVITSNLLLGWHNIIMTELMGDATLSRLKEMTDGWRVDMSGLDYRFRKKD